jgi:hypothetical protein
MTDAPRPPRQAPGYAYVPEEDFERDHRPDPLPPKRKRRATNFYLLQHSTDDEERPNKEPKKKKGKRTPKNQQETKKRRSRQAPSNTSSKKRKMNAAGPPPSSGSGQVLDHDSDSEKIAKMKDASATMDYNGHVLRTARTLVDFMYLVLKYHDRGGRFLPCPCS